MYLHGARISLALPVMCQCPSSVIDACVGLVYVMLEQKRIFKRQGGNLTRKQLPVSQ